MRKSAIALPAAALLGVTTLATGPAVTTAWATPAAPATSAVVTAKNKQPVKAAHIKRYKLGKKALREIRKSKPWARSSKARSVRRCESGGNYKINTGNGYYGAWQFAAGTWRGIGGGRYASYAHQAPKFAQDHMAWKLWRQQGWGPWSCA